MRQVATLLMISSAWWLALSPSVRAQSSDTKQSETSSQDENATPSNEADEATKNETNEQKIPEEQAEFDERILGPWVVLAKFTAGSPDIKAIKTAIARCFKSPKLSKLNIEPGAQRKLPNPANLAGDMVYYRTEKGLQRFDFSKGYLVLLTDLEKLEDEGKPVSWKISGATLRYRIRFANTQSRGGKGEFMVENDQLYLRCPRPDKKTNTTDQ